MYSVYDDLYARVKVSDEDIENSIKDPSPLKLEIISAMGISHRKKYLHYLYPYLDDSLQEQLCILASAISDMRNNSSMLEYIAEMTKGMSRKYYP